MSAPVFANGKKPKEDLCFYGKRWKVKTACGVCWAGSHCLTTDFLPQAMRTQPFLPKVTQCTLLLISWYTYKDLKKSSQCAVFVLLLTTYPSLAVEDPHSISLLAHLCVSTVSDYLLCCHWLRHLGAYHHLSPYCPRERTPPPTPQATSRRPSLWAPGPPWTPSRFQNHHRSPAAQPWFGSSFPSSRRSHRPLFCFLNPLSSLFSRLWLYPAETACERVPGRYVFETALRDVFTLPAHLRVDILFPQSVPHISPLPCSFQHHL